MSQPVCPQCSASLDDNLMTRTGSAECPFCGALLDPTDFIQPPDETTDGFSNAGSVEKVPAPGLPADSKIQVVESSSDRQVIFVPPGGKNTRGIGFFALFWNGFMTLFTPPWFFAGGDGPPLLFIIPFLGLFWAIGLGILYWWVRVRFMQFYILLERDRLTIQRVLFGRKSLKETILDPESQAELAVAYTENDVPVYAIAVQGTNRTAKFGIALSREEKDWFVDTINLFLGVISAESMKGQNDSGGTGLSGKTSTEEIVPDIDPATVSFDGPITIQDVSDDRLQMSYQAIPQGAIRTFVGSFSIFFSLIWFGVAVSTAATLLLQKNAGPAEIGFAAMAAIFSLSGSAPLLVGLFMFRGQTTVNITRDWFRCRWHVGPIGYTKKFATDSITNVIVASGMNAKYKHSGGNPGTRDSTGDVKVCMVFAAGKFIPLTFFHEIGIARTVAGLVLHQLHSMGFRLEDV